MIQDIVEAMLESQRMVQEGYGHTFPKPPEETMRYLTEMAYSVCDEIHEAMGETGWKSWTPGNHINREEFMGEMADAFLFFMNMMLAVGMTSDELIERVGKKQNNSFKRQKDGYDGVSTKCGRCRRAYDNDGVKCTPEACAYPPRSLGVVSNAIDTSTHCGYCNSEYGTRGCHPAHPQGFGWCGMNHKAFVMNGTKTSA